MKPRSISSSLKLRARNAPFSKPIWRTRTASLCQMARSTVVGESPRAPGFAATHAGVRSLNQALERSHGSSDALAPACLSTCPRQDATTMCRGRCLLAVPFQVNRYDALHRLAYAIPGVALLARSHSSADLPRAAIHARDRSPSTSSNLRPGCLWYAFTP